MQMELQNKLLLATNNTGKLKELRQLLAELPEITLVSPKELGLTLDVVETGSTYLENATLKAEAFMQASGLLSLADDSGLEVDALDGAPGLYSKRFGNLQGRDQHKYLLDKLAEVPEAARTARFRAVVVLSLPDGRRFTTEGVCEGRIGYQAVGTGGFGYDPLFYMPEMGATMAELNDEVKNKVSHRGRSIEAAIPILRQIFGLAAEGGLRGSV